MRATAAIQCVACRVLAPPAAGLSREKVTLGHCMATTVQRDHTTRCHGCQPITGGGLSRRQSDHAIPGGPRGERYLHSARLCIGTATHPSLFVFAPSRLASKPAAVQYMLQRQQLLHTAQLSACLRHSSVHRTSSSSSSSRSSRSSKHHRLLGAGTVAVAVATAWSWTWHTEPWWQPNSAPANGTRPFEWAMVVAVVSLSHAARFGVHHRAKHLPTTWQSSTSMDHEPSRLEQVGAATAHARRAR